jgi:PAS domain S-box-containing protein
VQVVEALLAAERQARRRLHSELDLRNCGLDSASTRFMILDITQSPWATVYANRAIAKDHGYEPAELPGRNPTMLTATKDNEVAFGRLRKAARKGGSASTELIARRKDGGRHEINTPIQYIGDSVSFLRGAQSDLEKLLTAYRATFKELAQNASPHAVLGHLEGVEKDLDLAFLDEEIPRAFDRTMEGVERVAAIVTEKHGGSVEVHSAVGSGTRFVLRLSVTGRPAANAT